MNSGSAYMPYGEVSYGASGQQERGSGQYNQAGQFDRNNQSMQYQGAAQQYGQYPSQEFRYGRNQQDPSSFYNRQGMQQRRNSFNDVGDRRVSFSEDRRGSMEPRNSQRMNQRGYNMGRSHSLDMNRRDSFAFGRRDSFGMDRSGIYRDENETRQGRDFQSRQYPFDQQQQQQYRMDRNGRQDFNRFRGQEFNRFGSQDSGRFGSQDFGHYGGQEFDRFENQDYGRYGSRYGRFDGEFNQFGQGQFNQQDGDMGFNQFGRVNRNQFSRNQFGRDMQGSQFERQPQFNQFNRFGREQPQRFDQYNPFEQSGDRMSRYGMPEGFGSDQFYGRQGNFADQKNFGGMNQSRFGRNSVQFQGQRGRGSFEDRFGKNSFDNRFRPAFEGHRRSASLDDPRMNSFEGPFRNGPNDANQFRRGSYETNRFRSGSVDANRFRSGSYDANRFRSGSYDASGRFRSGPFNAEKFSRRPFESNQYRRPSFDQNRRYSFDNQDRRGSYDQSQMHFGMRPFNQQFYQPTMPAPIPPFSEPRSSYPNTMAHSYDDQDRYGRYRMTRAREMAVRANFNLLRRRCNERPSDATQNPNFHMETVGPRAAGVPSDVLAVEFVDFRVQDNAKDHRTLNYEMVQEFDRPTPVFRRGQPIFLNINFRDRNFDTSRDNLFINFYYGPNPSVPKKTRVVLPVESHREFTKGPNHWDLRIHNQDQENLTLQIHIPAHCQVGQWYCVVETSKREVDMPRYQYRCPQEIYIIFNPFCREDATYVESDAHRNEYVMNDIGKIYTGGFRSVKGRPFVYGQFDDCVLPAACVLLEMSNLTHAERGNPAKVARALSSMIQANNRKRDSADSTEGLIEPYYEDDFRGGQSPHGWTGSVQIIEEFLRGGATPVRYGHCWIMAGLMTTLCRALGLPARPVTAFVTAHDTQDAMTVDRYLDRFGDLLERGPGRDQPDSVWSYHTWCDVWMIRSDLPSGYSGWQGTDPSRSYRDYRDMFSGSCGPASSEAVRKGDIGCSDDTDAFYSCLNANVRYFFEDEGSEWGFSPFRQYRYPVGRLILTKAVGRSDDEGVADAEEITGMYCDLEKNEAERISTFNASRGFRKEVMNTDYQAVPNSDVPYPPPEQASSDVSFEMMEPIRVMAGQPMVVTLQIHNNSNENRTVRANISARSCYYNGVMGPHLKRVTNQYTLGAGQSDVLPLRLDAPEIQGRLVDQGFIKITASGFVQETLHTYVDEYDFRFEKPKLELDISPECKVGQECQLNMMFQNPLEVSLSDCFVTIEVPGSVRPRTIRVNRDVRPGESFKFSHTFVPRRPGDKKLVATFTSRQLQDVTGQCRFEIRE